jgi:regulator of protease activity HflC (stomatin/prohibitin superfamily)
MELIRLLMEIITTLWPLREVHAWEMGVRFWCNRPTHTVGPGIYWVLPYIEEVRGTSTVPAVVTTPMSVLTLQDGTTLNYSVSATVEIIDAIKALVEIDDAHETAQELITARIAEYMAGLDPKRLEADARGRLLAALQKVCNTELNQYGINVKALRFTNFALNLRTYRLLTDSSGLSSAW